MNWTSQNLRPALQAWAAVRWSVAVSVLDIRDLGGHSGQTFAFRIVGETISEHLVIRLVPANIPQRGSSDLLRQANLLRALDGLGPWIPTVRNVNVKNVFFDAPVLIVNRLEGQPLIMGPGAVPSGLSSVDRQRAHCLAAESLAAIHAVDVARQLPHWDAPRSLDEEIEFCTKVMAKSPEAGWLNEGTRLRTELLERQPRSIHVGLFHGDFQTNNVLFTGPGASLKVSGVVDWEVAGIGATELDLAWFLMMNDAHAWHPVEQRGGLDLEAVTTAYATCAKRRPQDMGWFRALACFRMSAIAAFNIRLHRSGKRPDASWERAALSVPIMMARAFALLNDRSA